MDMTNKCGCNCLWMLNQYVCTFVDVKPFSMVAQLCQTTKHGSTFVDVKPLSVVC